ncbi:hypothetical protein PP348_20220 [Mycobacteroides abscessus]|uniref:hypothetical protein n=1 Tax=Mycobacteroides abscessus TaxID=36809 RepID=UPI0021052DA5|nr:hypothetical protein [Mycobacteroides abscessus]MDM2096403.1 hypothetical protein [Mycobacteroides abscessus]MDM2121134.1 hypothetical protein [Mycobacteroides abscessus]MDM2124371.1 hypothetical protein [Mycobacteroides abscessus]MDM2130556.1 hypothetical protein [Mycobacteroides abscessus]MDM2203055.1 hypothetical protein [Mycobacteroides abscessus]
MADEPLPPIEYEPPYSLNFVAHLDAGCYPDDLTPELLAGVRRDPAGAGLLDLLTTTQLELRLLG